MEKNNKLLAYITAIFVGIIVVVIISNASVLKNGNSNFSNAVTDISKNMTGIVEKMTKSNEKMAHDMIKAIESFAIMVPSMTDNKNVEIAPHPYNICIKLLIDQVNHENSKSDFDKMKSVCYELMKDKNKESEVISK